MTYLRFDTDRGRDTVARLRQVVENMRTESESTHANINALVGNAWIAPAAYEFQNTASELRQSLSTTLTGLTELNARLDTEIAEWEETAVVFGGGGSPVGLVKSEGETGQGGSQDGTTTPLSGVGVGKIPIGGTGVFGSAKIISGENFVASEYTVVEGDISDEVSDKRFESSISANFFEKEGEIGDAVYDKRFGDVEIAALGAEAAGAASLGVISSGLQGKMDGQASVYLGQVEVEKTVAGVELAGEAQVGGQISGEGKVSLNPLKGDVGVKGEVGAFVGGSVEGQAGMDIGAVGVEAGGRVGYGWGAGADIDVGYSDGVLALGWGAYAFAGVGGGTDFSTEINIPEAIDSIIDVAEDATDIGSDIWHEFGGGGW